MITCRSAEELVKLRAANQLVARILEDLRRLVVPGATTAGIDAAVPYYGGGIHVARDARMDDGQFEVYVLGDIHLLTALRYLHTFYLGTYLRYPHLVRRYTGTRITAQSDERVLLNLDGEQPGQLPAAIELLPAALPFVVPHK